MASSLAMRDLRKAIGMRQIHQECLAQESCLGTFAFMWGWKFEHTPTWFSTFNEPWFKGMTGLLTGGVSSGSFGAEVPTPKEWRAAGFDEPASDVVQAMQDWL